LSSKNISSDADGESLGSGVNVLVALFEFGVGLRPVDIEGADGKVLRFVEVLVLGLGRAALYVADGD